MSGQNKNRGAVVAGHEDFVWTNLEDLCCVLLMSKAWIEDESLPLTNSGVLSKSSECSEPQVLLHMSHILRPTSYWEITSRAGIETAIIALSTPWCSVYFRRLSPLKNLKLQLLNFLLSKFISSFKFMNRILWRGFSLLNCNYMN